MSPQQKFAYFKPLTGVRAIAAYMVFIHHFNPFNHLEDQNILKSLVSELHIGVTLFFVLSGYLIAYRYFDQVKIDFKKYMVNRFSRIYPMYFLLTCFTFSVSWFFQKDDPLKQFGLFLSNITFIRGYFDDIKFTGVAPGWSLTVEETFYMIAPLSFFLIKKSKTNIVLVPLLLILFGSLMVFLFKDINYYGFFGSFEFMFNYTFFGRCCEFFLGIGLALIMKENYSFKFRVPIFTYSGLLFIVFFIYLLTTVKGDADLGIQQPFGKIINTFLLPGLGVCSFYYGLIRENTIISKILGSNVFVLLGKSSYVFYLIHAGIINYSLQKLGLNNFYIFIVINIISIVLYKYIEEPLNGYLRSKLKMPFRSRAVIAE